MDGVKEALSTWWRAGLRVCFVLLCLRFEVAALRGPDNASLPSVILIVSGAILGFRAIAPALLALVISTPLLNGLVQAAFLQVSAPISVVLCAMFLGGWLKEIGAGATTKPIGELIAGRRCSRLSWPYLLFLDIMASAIIISLLLEIFNRHHNAFGLNSLLERNGLGYGDSYYFLNSAFLWLQGIFLFRQLSVYQALGSHTVRTSLICATLVAFVLYVIQIVFNSPEPYRSDPSDPIQALGLFSPYDDISSFGSLSVAQFIFFATSFRPREASGRRTSRACIAILLIMVITSWSRGAWLSGIIMSTIVAWGRLSKRWFFTLIAAGAIVVIVANTSLCAQWKNPYFTRFRSLVRVESLAQKNSGRFNLFFKAAKMIQAKPFFGHGIGSFYLTSPNYASTGDPAGTRPDFAHNAILQLEAELGLPGGVVFCFFIAALLFRAVTTLHRQRFQNTQSANKYHLLKYRRSRDHLVALVFGLIAYLLTQMTANSLNVYVSNQIFFWFFAAALYNAETIWALER